MGCVHYFIIFIFHCLKPPSSFLVMRRQTLTIILGGFLLLKLFYCPPVEPGVYFRALKDTNKTAVGQTTYGSFYM
jgi:hypothetical protein